MSNSTLRDYFNPVFVIVQLLSRVRLYCDPTDCSQLGSSVHGISQAKTLEWVAISFSKGSSQPRIIPRSPALPQILYRLSHHGSPILILLFFKRLTEINQKASHYKQ